MEEEEVQELTEQEVNELVGRKLREVRKSKNVSQEKLGDDLGYSSQNVSNIENAKRGMGVAKLYKICFKLNMKLSEFFKRIGL